MTFHITDTPTNTPKQRMRELSESETRMISSAENIATDVAVAAAAGATVGSFICDPVCAGIGAVTADGASVYYATQMQ